MSEEYQRDVNKFECECMGVTGGGLMFHAVDCEDWNWHLKFTSAVAKWEAAGKPWK